MSQEDIALSELERDALTELVNIGVSRSAASLRLMVGREVLLSVPSVAIIGNGEAAALISEREGEELVAVSQDFAGAFSGRAMLIFPQSNSLDLVRAVVGEEMSADDIRDMEKEALSETGNVILNGCLGTMANMLQKPISLSLPLVLHGPGRRLFQLAEHHTADGLVLFLYINFAVREQNIRGYIAMLLDIPSMAALKTLVQTFIASVMGDDAPIA